MTTTGTGLYYYRARYYDPAAGHFLSEDPMGFGGGDVNLYRYAANDPVDLGDPTGTSIVGDIRGGVSRLVTAGRKWVGAHAEGIRTALTVIAVAAAVAAVVLLAAAVLAPAASFLMACGATAAVCWWGAGVILGRGGGLALGAARGETETASKELEPLWAQVPNNGIPGGASVTETLQPGTTIDRYGNEMGSFFSPAGTSFGARPSCRIGATQLLDVLKPFEVQGGIVGPAFGQPGLGVQYMSPQTVAELRDGGFIKLLTP